MSVWTWVHSWRMMHEDSDDPDVRELMRLGRLASGGDIDAALRACESGVGVAKRMKEPWWELFFLHWRLQHLIHDKEDLAGVPELAVAATVRATKGDCAGCPQRICLHEDLISTYIARDPLGDAEIIARALDYMRREISDDLECRFCLLGHQGTFDLLHDRVDEAEQSARTMLEMLADTDPEDGAHYRMTAYARLCETAYHRGDWDAVEENARQGEALRGYVRRPVVVAEFLTWLAVVMRLRGEDAAAAKKYRQAVRLVERGGATPPSYLSLAMVLYHEACGDFEKALGVREAELALLDGKGRLDRECRVRVSICELTARLGRDISRVAADARAVVSKLKKPQPLLVRLDALAAGGGS